MSDHERQVETQEIIKRLQSAGFGKLVDAMRDEPKCYTASGRINCSAIGREMKASYPEVKRMIDEARKIGEELF